jgi:hypothetical protein
MEALARFDLFDLDYMSLPSAYRVDGKRGMRRYK